MKNSLSYISESVLRSAFLVLITLVFNCYNNIIFAHAPVQYITINEIGPTDDEFSHFSSLFPSSAIDISIGVGCILSYFSSPSQEIQDKLRQYLNLSVKYNIPIEIQISGEIYWNYRSDLWNWWNPDYPGYNPENRNNVEWTGWTPDSAVKTEITDWGIPPKVNFMSPKYRTACYKEMTQLIPIIVEWWHGLPEDKKQLFIGLTLGWESSISDPDMGYAAVSTAGIANSGPMKEAYKTEVIRRHLEDLSRMAWKLGVPRNHIFTHSGGKSQGESLYPAAVNSYSCPGWSFYDYASDITKDTSIMNALKLSDAPYWGAVAYLLPGNKTKDEWYQALINAFNVKNLRYLSVYNWSSIRENENAINAIQKLLKVPETVLVGSKYIILNQSNISESVVNTISGIYGDQSDKHTVVGFGTIISVLNSSPGSFLNQLNNALGYAVKYNMPVQIKLDVEIWWGYRKDLWNWWDISDLSSYDSNNKNNVEWTSWEPGSAIKIGWLNWGRQIRMPPCPNFMSKEYIDAWHVELTKAVNAIKTWYDGLPQNKKYLFCGIVVGWESSIGMSVFHYPNGNSYLVQPESNDPTYGKTVTDLPSRGVQTIGYAAVKTANIKTEGTLTEADQAEAVRRHLEDLSHTVYGLGIPREKIFTHTGGWVEGESLYFSGINQYSCPGWSFYKYASNPSNDPTAMDALATSDAPYWGAVEWLLQGNKTQEQWESALSNSLANNAKLVSIYNWSGINTDQNALNAIKQINK